MKTTAEEIKNKIANNNNFDSFDIAIRYTFGREPLPSEKEFLNRIINEAMEEFASLKKDKWISVEEKARKLLDAIRVLHPNLNIGDKKQEAVYMAYHELSFWLAENLPSPPKTEK